MSEQEKIIDTRHLFFWVNDGQWPLFTTGIVASKIKPYLKRWKAYIEMCDERYITILRNAIKYADIELLARPEGRPDIYGSERVQVRLKSMSNLRKISGFSITLPGGDDYQISEFTLDCDVEFVNLEVKSEWEEKEARLLKERFSDDQS